MAEVELEERGEMTIIPPAIYEPIYKAIGDIFSFDDLNIVVYKCLGERRINDYANEDDPRWQVARDVIDGIERDEATKFFLSEILFDKRCDAYLTSLIYKVDPQIKAAERNLKARVEALDEDLRKTKDALTDDAARRSLKDSSATFANFSVAVGVLQIYKFLHDALHLLQVRRFVDLRDAVETMDDDHAAEGRLRDFQNGMRECVVLARKAAARLPIDVRPQETLWIDKLDQRAVEELRTAIDGMDIPSARIALRIAAKLIESESSRLNGLIFLSASNLPLKALAAGLENAANIAPLVKLPLLSTANSANLLAATLQSHVVEHGLWQDVDDTLWAVDVLLTEAGNDILKILSEEWLNAEAVVLNLVRPSADEVWALDILKYGERMKEALSGAIELAATPAVTEADLTDAIDGLILRYGDFRYEVRFRFFVIDQLLMSDCEEIVKLRTSVNAVLEALGHE
ncbi:hypothetical protein [Mesorhizobium sp. M0633]|uniref:hypothetical protein n=1 Tax=Mesorhizobium sp. M0633 TaxID=2956977 RepID=UPI00333CCFF9